MTTFGTHLLRQLARAALLGAVALLAACGGGSDDDAGAPAGTLRLALADAPSCGFDHVHVTVLGVRVHRSADAGPGDAGWVDLMLPAPRRLDLLTLVNGTLEELGQAPLAAGRYTQMRLLLAPNTAGSPLANAATPSGGAEVALTTPSAVQSGLKTNVDIEVRPFEVADFVIDFDACRSVVRAGRSGQYLLKPVLRVLPRLAGAGARVVGHVAGAGATVSLQVDGEPVRATTPDPATGRYELYPVAPGSYTLVVAGGGRATGVVTGVPVHADRATVVGTATAPIVLPPAVPREVGGELTVAASLTGADHATVRATQAYGGAAPLVVEVAQVPVAIGDVYTLTLDAAAPRIAAYDAGTAAPSFAAADAVAGRYTLQARLLPLGLTRAAALDIGAGVPDPLPDVDFAFP